MLSRSSWTPYVVSVCSSRLVDDWYYQNKWLGMREPSLRPLEFIACLQVNEAAEKQAQRHVKDLREQVAECIAKHEEAHKECEALRSLSNKDRAELCGLRSQVAVLWKLGIVLCNQCCSVLSEHSIACLVYNICFSSNSCSMGKAFAPLNIPFKSQCCMQVEALQRGKEQAEQQVEKQEAEYDALDQKMQIALGYRCVHPSLTYSPGSALTHVLTWRQEKYVSVWDSLDRQGMSAGEYARLCRETWTRKKRKISTCSAGSSSTMMADKKIRLRPYKLWKQSWSRVSNTLWCLLSSNNVLIALRS